MPEAIDHDQRLSQLKARIEELFKPWLDRGLEALYHGSHIKIGEYFDQNESPEYKELVAAILEYLLHSPDVQVKKFIIDLYHSLPVPERIKRHPGDYANYNDKKADAAWYLESEVVEGLRSIARKAILENPSEVHQHCTWGEEITDQIKATQKDKISGAVGKYLKGLNQE